MIKLRYLAAPEILMPYKNILLNLNETRRNPVLLDVAAKLAGVADGHVTGLYVIPAVQLYPSTAFEAMPAILETQRDYFKGQRASVEAMFRETMRRHGVRSDLRVVDSSSPLISDLTIEQGRRVDLVLLSQVDTEGNEGVELDFVDRVVMAVGRPVLAIPLKADAPEFAGGTAIIGWNGSREAARAVFDSLPLLRHAKQVCIVSVDPQCNMTDPPMLAGTDLAETLARHGVNAIVEPVPGNGREAGEALLIKTFDTGAGLLVMGAYGHARLREFILGGATRHILKQMNCPVLFSH
jgi:nucleotide-binding universal stress UspA family protein